jgi:phosphate transport system substrate-binding protein
MKKKILVLLITFLFFRVLLFPQSIDGNEPAKVVQDVDLYKYVPFTQGNKLVSLDRNSTFRLSENLPRLDGATALYPVYASFVQAVYPDNIIGPNRVSIYYEFYRGIV